MYKQAFKIWVLEGTTISLINRLVFPSGVCDRTLQNKFHKFLDNPPNPVGSDYPLYVFLKADGTYWKRWGCTLAYKAGSEIIFWDCVEKETYLDYIRNFEEIKKGNYIVSGITSDKHSSIVSAVKAAFPGIPHQYCLVHIQRRCQALLTRNPKTEAGQRLLEIVKFVNKISDHYEREIWTRWLLRFEKRFLDFINQRTYATTDDEKRTWWYTHKNVRSAFRYLRSSLDNMFLYLDYPGLCKDTNGLEAEFTYLKERVGKHRGLNRERKMNLVRWYFHFKINDHKSR